MSSPLVVPLAGLLRNALVATAGDEEYHGCFAPQRKECKRQRERT
jgi:hypothetical protein